MCNVIVFLVALSVSIFPAVACAERGIVINAVGDIMMAASATPILKERGYDYPFAGTASCLLDGDLSIGNLEGPIAGYGREFQGKKFRFLGTPHSAAAMKRAGFTILTLANNHIMDFGPESMEATRNILRRAGVLSVGAGSNLDEAERMVIVEVKGKRVAFLSYSFVYPAEFFAGESRPGTAPGLRGRYRRGIAAARKRADYVVASFHWGRESAPAPAPYQVEVAHGAIDAGADVVIGHHPHVLQGIEFYRGGVVFYSLGNFVFGSFGMTAQKSAIARVTLDGGIRNVEVIPLDVFNRRVLFQPRQLGASDGARFAKDLTTLSGRWGTTIRQKGGRFLASRRVPLAVAAN